LDEQRKITYTSVSAASYKARCFTAVPVVQQEGQVGKGREKDLVMIMEPKNKALQMVVDYN